MTIRKSIYPPPLLQPHVSFSFWSRSRSGFRKIGLVSDWKGLGLLSLKKYDDTLCLI